MEGSGELHAPTALLPGKIPRYTLDRRLDGLQSLSEQNEEEKILYTIGTRTPNTARSQSLYRLFYPGSYINNGNYFYFYFGKNVSSEVRILSKLCLSDITVEL
jgi:hypothetical protein